MILRPGMPSPQDGPKRWILPFALAVGGAVGCTGEVLPRSADGQPTSGGPNVDRPPEDGDTPSSPSDPGSVGGTRVVDTLAQTCEEPDNLMPDIRRLTNLSYVEAVAEFTGYRMPRDAVVAALPAQNRDQIITNVDFGLRVGRVFTSRVVDLTETIVNEMDWGPFFEAHHQGCTSATAECREGFVRSAFNKAVAREPTTEELEVFMTVYTEADAIGLDFEAASRLVTRAILASPQFMFVDADGSSGDALRQRTQRISLLLYNQPNHPEVLRAAEEGLLDTRQQVETYVREALRDQKVTVALDEFYYDWLNLDRLDYTIDLSNEDYASYTLETNNWLREDLLSYLRALVFDETTPFIRAFDDRRAFVRPETAWVYDAELSPEPGGSMADLAQVAKRSGVLTQPAMLTVSLKIEDKSIVDRGVFVNEHILCREIPLPAAVTPIDQTQFPETASQRDKLQDHKQGACAGCHVMLDAPGYALEMFGPVGEFNATDRHGNELRDDGTFEIDQVESAFTDVFGFTDLLANSDELVRCIVRKRLSHALAKVVNNTDFVCEVDRLEAIFRESNYDMKELTVGIATSHYFMQ